MTYKPTFLGEVVIYTLGGRQARPFDGEVVGGAEAYIRHRKATVLIDQEKIERSSN